LHAISKIILQSSYTHHFFSYILRLMDNNFSSISEIAYQSGFNNVASFNRAFKTLMKKSPRAFMKEYQTETESV